MSDHRHKFVLHLLQMSSVSRVNEGSDVQRSAQLNRLANLASHKAKSLQLNAKHCRRLFEETSFLGWNFDLAFFTLIHTVLVLSVAKLLLTKEMLKSFFDIRCLSDVNKNVHKMLESCGYIFASKTCDILTHVAAKYLVERCRFFACRIKTFTPLDCV